MASEVTAGSMPCPRCNGRLEPSGYEPTRHICMSCKQHYQMVLQLVPVEAPTRPLLLTGLKDIKGAG